MSKRFYKSSPRDFKEWLHERVWINGCERCPRSMYIPAFADELTNWCKRKGYVMDGRWKKGHLVVARWMYALHVQVVARRNRYGEVGYPEIRHRDWPEDKDVFDINIDQEAVEEFFDTWREAEDFDMKTDIGLRTVCELPTLLWHYVDLDSSYHGRKMARILETDSEEESEEEDFRNDYMSDLTNGLHGTTKKILGINTL